MKDEIYSLQFPRVISYKELPAYKRFEEQNDMREFSAKEIATNYGLAVHWLSFLDILFPPFKDVDNYIVHVSYLVANDPDWKNLPPTFDQQITIVLKYLWTLQLGELLPHGEWFIQVNDPDNEVGDMYIEAIINKRIPINDEKSNSSLVDKIRERADGKYASGNVLNISDIRNRWLNRSNKYVRANTLKKRSVRQATKDIDLLLKEIDRLTELLHKS